MLVIVDANVIMKDPLLRDRKWDAAKVAIDAERLRLVLPEVARSEAVGGYRRNHEEKIRQVMGVIRKSTDRAKVAAQALLEVYADEVKAYESILNARLEDIGVEIPHPPELKHVEVTERAVHRLPPFNQDGGGYRDTLLWLTAIEQVEEEPFDNLILLSDDGIFTKRSAELAEELRRETGAELKILRSITGVEFPGEYAAGDFDLSDLDIDLDDIVKFIKSGLPSMDISRWSPPGPDYVEVKLVGRLDLLEETIEVRKRYGSDIHEVSGQAIADIDAEVLLIHADDLDYSQLSARWDVRVQWLVTADARKTRLNNDGSIEVLEVYERRRDQR